MSREFYQEVSDPLWDVSTQKVPIDKDTVARKSSYITAQTGPNGSLAAPLNSGQDTIFSFNQESVGKLHWDTLGLRLRTVFTLSTDPTAACPVSASAAGADFNMTPAGLPFSAPSWNLTAALINSIKLEINGNQVFNSTNGDFLLQFTSNLLRFFDYETLNNYDDMLFTPCFTKSYTCSSAQAATGQAADATHYTNVLPKLLACLSSDFVTFTGHNDAAGQFIGHNPDWNPLAADPALKERAIKYCTGNTHQKEVVKVIPFNLLFPAFPAGMYRNLRTVRISIKWVNSTDLLDNFSTAGGATKGCVRLIGCDIISDSYRARAPLETRLVAEKMPQGSDAESLNDYISYLEPQVFRCAYTPNSEFLIPSIVNFDSLMILQPCRSAVDASFTNGKAGADARAYTAWGEMLLGGNSVAANALIKLHANDPVGTPTDSVAGFESVQLNIGGDTYPESPIMLSQSQNGVVCAEFAHIYNEYLKGIGKFGKTHLRPGVPFDVFKTTMPFIFIRPHSDNAPHLSNPGKDIIIRLRGGVASTYFIVVFTLRTMCIMKDGSVKNDR